MQNTSIPDYTHYWIQKPMFTSTIFLLLVFWKKGSIDYDSPEYRAVELATEMVQLTSKR